MAGSMSKYRNFNHVLTETAIKEVNDWALTTYAGKKVTIGVGHFQIIDFFYDW